MWTRASTDGGVCEHTHAIALRVLRGAAGRAWLPVVGALVAGVLLAACSSAPPKPTEEPAQPVTSAPPAAGKSGTAGTAGTPTGAPGAAGAPGATPPVPVAVTARGNRWTLTAPWAS